MMDNIKTKINKVKQEFKSAGKSIIFALLTVMVILVIWEVSKPQPKPEPEISAQAVFEQTNAEADQTILKAEQAKIEADLLIQKANAEKALAEINLKLEGDD